MVTGYASEYGLAWLQHRTGARPVRMLVGDIGAFASHSQHDRAEAIQFLGRPDVAVGTRYGPMVHAKGWMVEPDPAASVTGGVLHGSANLTKNGLHRNMELMSEVASSDVEELRAKIRDTVEHGQSMKVQLLERLGALPTTVAEDTSKDSPRSHRWQGSPIVRPAGRRFSFRTHRRSHRGRGSPIVRQLAMPLALIVAGFLVLRFVLPLATDLLSDALAPADGSESPAGRAPAAPAPSVAGEPSVGTGPTVQFTRRVGEDDAAASTLSATLAERPLVSSTAPPQGWVPAVDGIASSYGEPDRADLQWVAWQPGCPSCEAGATLTRVGSYAYPFNGSVTGSGGSTRPMLLSACLHRERSGPLINWNRDMSEDRVVSVWADGESVDPGLWWVGGPDSALTIPEPAAFLGVLDGARELRVVTSAGLDATFAVEGFLTTPVQANLDHCGHYP